MFSDFLTHRRHQTAQAQRHNIGFTGPIGVVFGICLYNVSPNTPASALQSLFDVLVRDIYDITSGARVCAGGSSCMILLDFRPTKQGFERCDMQRHTSSTEPIGLILAHTPPRMSLGRGVPSIPCIHAGVSKKP